MVPSTFLAIEKPARRNWLVFGLIVLVTGCKLDPVPNGSSCTLASECPSGHCVDGVCCDTECTSSCHACTAVLKGDGVDGVCGIIKPGTELPTECPNGACTMSGVCGVDPPTNLCNSAADCASGFCVGGVCCAESSCTAIDSCHLATCSTGTCTDIPRVCPNSGMCVDGVCPGQCIGAIGFSGLPVIPYYTSRDGDVWDVVTGDMDGDGFGDLVVSTYGLNGSQYLGSIGVFRNNGNATFTPVPMGIQGGIDHDVLGLADMNNDGALDVIDAGYRFGEKDVSVYLNNGPGGFTPIYGSFGPGGGVGKLVMVDVNNDGFRDIMARGSGSEHLLVKLNNAGTALGATVDTAIMGDDDFDAVDLNADGHADLVLAFSMTNSVEVRFGNGNGTFGSPVSYPAVTGVNAVALRDIDADGDSDLVASNGIDTHVRINVGNGVFAAAVLYNGGSAKFADLNGDGHPDVLGSTTLFNNGDGTFAEQMMGYMPLENAAFGDVNGDGLADIARVVHGVGVSVLLNQGNGAFTLPYTQYDLSVDNIHQMVSADLNGDNLDDLALITSVGKVAVRINMGNGNYAPPVEYPTSSTPIVLAAADMDADGKLDLVASGDTNVAVLFNMGGGIFGPAIEYTVKPLQKWGSATGDFNGDGYPDVARLEPPAENSTLSVMFNQGNGTLGPRVEMATLTMDPNMTFSDSVFPEEIVATDLNADGFSDLVVRGGPAGIEIFMSDGTGGFVLRGQTIFGGSIDSFLVADYNGDGFPDIASVDANVETGFGPPNSYSTISLNNGDGTFHYWQSQTYSFFSYAAISVAADVDGNGLKDLIIHKEALSVYLNDGVALGPEIRYMTGGGLMIATDVNGDGISELLSSIGVLHEAVCIP